MRPGWLSQANITSRRTRTEPSASLRNPHSAWGTNKIQSRDPHHFQQCVENVLGLQRPHAPMHLARSFPACLDATALAPQHPNYCRHVDHSSPDRWVHITQHPASRAPQPDAAGRNRDRLLQRRGALRGSIPRARKRGSASWESRQGHRLSGATFVTRVSCCWANSFASCP